MQAEKIEKKTSSLGGTTTLLLAAGVVAAAVFGYQYLSAGSERNALEAEVLAACNGVLGASPMPAADSNLFSDLDFYEQRKKDLAGCGAAQMKLQMYLAGVDVSDL